MGFILFMLSIPFLHGIEVSLLTSGCNCEYTLTMSVLRMCTVMAKMYGIPSSMRNFCFPKRETHLLSKWCTDISIGK